MSATILVNEAKNMLELVPLSNNVIPSRIADLSLHILEQVISYMKASPLKISLQLDETADIWNCSQLIALVSMSVGRILQGENSVFFQHVPVFFQDSGVTVVKFHFTNSKLREKLFLYGTH